MTQADYDWLTLNLFIFGNVRLTEEQTNRLFKIYSEIDGKVHKPTSCGRCVWNAKNTVKAQYEKF